MTHKTPLVESAGLINIWAMPSDDPNFDCHQAKRLEWFEKISPKSNWKNPIHATIEEVDFDNCNQAAIYFTGGPLTISRRSGTKVRVRGAGYYANVGA